MYFVTRYWRESTAKGCDANGEKFTVDFFAIRKK
jgi:hypothetical protein